MNATTTQAADLKLQGCTSFKVRQLMRRVTQHYDAEVGQSGLKTSQYSLLSHLGRLGAMRPVDLAARMTLTASTLSRNLQPLIDAGWVAVEAGPDARSHLLRLTEAGVEKRRETQAHWKVAQQSLNAKLGVGRVAQLHALIDETLLLLADEADSADEA